MLLYLEAVTGLRLYLPLYLEANIGDIGSCSATHLFLLFAINRFVCIFAPLSYDSIFNKRNTWLAIGFAWFLGIHCKMQFILRGERQEHCWASGLVGYRGVPENERLGEMVLLQFLAKLQYVSMATPTLFDIAVLAKLGIERLPFSPFHRYGNYHNDRVRTFMVCLTTSAYHVLFVLVIIPLTTNQDFIHVLSLIATVLPSSLILLFSPGYRKQFKDLYVRKCFCRKNDNIKTIHGMVKQVQVCPSISVMMIHANAGMVPIQAKPARN